MRIYDYRHKICSKNSATYICAREYIYFKDVNLPFLFHPCRKNIRVLVVRFRNCLLQYMHECICKGEGREYIWIRSGELFQLQPFISAGRFREEGRVLHASRRRLVQLWKQTERNSSWTKWNFKNRIAGFWIFSLKESLLKRSVKQNTSSSCIASH